MNRNLRLFPMSDGPKTNSTVVKSGMDRVCRDFTQVVAPLGFHRTNARSRSWERSADQLVQIIYFHRSGSTYGTPTNCGVDIRVHFSFRKVDGTRAGNEQLVTDQLRDSRGYAYHLRFNAETGSMYDRCLEDLLRVTREQGLPLFERNGAYQHFIELLQAFIAAQKRSRDDVRALETEFARHFDNDDRFADLQYELAMYGAEGGSSDASLTRECEWALKLLLGEMW